MDTQALKLLNSKIKNVGPSKINSGEWIMVVLLLVFIDIAQIILDLFAVGVAVNRFIDIGVALLLSLYLVLRGEFSDPETRIRIIAIIILSFALEEVPILDAAPFWTGDGLYFWHLSKKRTERANEAKEAKQKMEKQQVIQDQREQLVKVNIMRQRQYQNEQNIVDDNNDIEEEAA